MHFGVGLAAIRRQEEGGGKQLLAEESISTKLVVADFRARAKIQTVAGVSACYVSPEKPWTVTNDCVKSLSTGLFVQTMLVIIAH